MNVIDIHSHVAFSSLYPDRFVEELARDLGALLQAKSKTGQGIESSRIASLVQALLKDKHCDQMIRQMDKANIESAVLLVIDAELGMGKPAMEIEEILEHHHEIMLRHPGRFKLFAGIDPRRGERGLNLFNQGVRDLHFQGLKLYPPMGYAMDDDRLLPFYERCQTHKLPVLIHTGPSFASLQNELAHPEAIIPMAKAFPELSFILAHAGASIADPEMQKLLTIPNVYMDISGFQQGIAEGGDRFGHALMKIFDPAFNQKVLFGTDWPLFHLMVSLKSNVDYITNLFRKSLHAANEEALKNVMYSNAKTLLKSTDSHISNV